MMTKEDWKSDLTMATWNVRTLILGKMWTCKENGSGSDAKEDDGRKTVYRMKERKTSFEIDGMTL
jgi:hypothetical protein